MARTAQGSDLILALVLVVLGILVLLGELSVGALLPVVGIVLIVLGALMLLNVVPGGVLWGVIAIVLGILLQVGLLDVPGQLLRAINLVIGIALLVLGALKLAGK